MPADPNRYGIDGSTRGSELADAAQHLTPAKRVAFGAGVEDVAARVQAAGLDRYDPWADPNAEDCPQGCGDPTDDPYGGPCSACWRALDREDDGDDA